MNINASTLLFFIELFYVFFCIIVCIQIIKDTRSTSKTLAYLLLVFFVPVFGILFYFLFGINYRKRKIYSKKISADSLLLNKLKSDLLDLQKDSTLQQNTSVIHNKELIRLLANRKTDGAPIFPKNDIQLLINGENFFPPLIEALQNAKSHIHIEFYIFENDVIGNKIKEILLQKAKEGVEVRFIYDDYGSRGIRKNIVKELIAGGVKAFPFNEIRFIYLANRINYRNHRKIVIVDGTISFVGGINVSDKYINGYKNKLFWRDTSIRIEGYATYGLQQVFIADWNFCSNENLQITSNYFPSINPKEHSKAVVQIVSNGPDSEIPSILYSIIQAINLAEQEILITTPYYIPESSLQEALIIAALSGIEVKMLVPKHADSKIVNIATQSYFDDLLRAGVRIFQYDKGFVHAKTFVTDRKLVSVGTANLDLRSFDLNFEVNAIIYDEKTAIELAEIFDKDLEHAIQINYSKWRKRNRIRKFIERITRLLSPFL